MMQRCVRQHDSNVGIARRNGRGAGSLRIPRRSSTIGASGERRSRCSIGSTSACSRMLVKRRKHQRERLFFPPLSSTQPADRRSRCVHPPSGESRPGPSPPRSFLTLRRDRGTLQRVVAARNDCARFVPQLQLRTALRTGVGLGMKAAVARIVVLRRTFRAHLENSHRSARPVVGQRFDDGEAWSAVGAVGEGIAIPAIAGIEDLTLGNRCRSQCPAGSARSLRRRHFRGFRTCRRGRDRGRCARSSE